MATLLIDAGNTRIKWALLRDGTLGPVSAAAHAGWEARAVTEQVLLPAGPIDRAVVSNVAGPRLETALRHAIRDLHAVEPEFVQSVRDACGVRSGYADPAQLGVDRWVALIGARSLHDGPACIVSVGTAMTIDGLDRAGQHHGGLIVPGPDLMIDSLLRGTSDIAARATPGPVSATVFADNTRAAIREGAAQALAALVDRAIESFGRELGEVPTLIVTGGASERVVPYLRTAVRHEAALVLTGLVVITLADHNAPSAPRERLSRSGQ